MFRLISLVLGMLSVLQAKSLKVFVLTGQANSLGTVATTDGTMRRPAPGSHPAEGPMAVPFFWDNRVDGTPAGDAALGDSSGAWVDLGPQKGGYYANNDDHWGPEIGFARMLWNAGYRDFGIVKASQGNGGNRFWVKGGTDDHMYQDVVATVQAAVAVLPAGFDAYEVSGLLYVEGESNDTTEANEADVRFSGLLANLKVDLTNAADLKGVFGEIGGGATTNRDLTRSRQLALAAARGDIGYAKSAGLVQYNNLHYDADSILLLGERMAAEAIGIGCFSQTPLPAWDNLYAWYVADNGAMPGADDKVLRWASLANGSAARDLTRTVAGRPVLRSVATGSGQLRMVMDFDGTTDLWASSAEFGFLDGARSVAVLARVTGTGDGFLFDGSTTAGRTRAEVRGGDWQAGVSNTSWDAVEPVTTARNVDVWQRHVFTFTPGGGGTAVEHWINGTKVASVSDPVAAGLRGLIVASNGGSPSLRLAVEVAEVAVYQMALEATAVATLEANWLARWGEIAGPPLAVVVGQVNREIARFGSHPLLSLRVDAPEAGTSVESLTVTLKAGTRQHVKALRLISTGGDAGFDAGGTVLGEVLDPAVDSFQFTTSSPLAEGGNHFWVAIEPHRWSPLGTPLDGTIDEIVLGGTEVGTVAPEDGDPAGVLTLAAVPLVSTVRSSGDFGVNTYRIPGIASDADGVMHAVFDHRWTGAGDLPADIDVGYARSVDGGASWSGFQAIMDYDSSVPGSSGNGVGDPCILYDPVTGTLWVAALWSFGNNGYNGSGAGTDPAVSGQYVLTKSEDAGLTWSAPINVTVAVKDDPNWRLVFDGPGHGLAMQNGTLVFPSQYRDSSGTVRVCSVFSSDHGATWDFGAGVPDSSPQTNENTVCELDDGDLLFSMRTPTASNGQRAWIRYTPGGAEPLRDGTWGSLFRLPSVPDPVCQGSVIQWSSTHRGAPRERLAFVNPASATSRVNLTLRVSGDGGATWPVARVIDTDASAYSSVCVLPDQSLGILYENDNYTRLTFVRVEEEWLWNKAIDGDNDGMPDAWEIFNGTNPGVDDAAVDGDHDGVENLTEYRSGTDPLNGDSALRVTGIAEEGGELVLDWTTVPGREYVVEKSTELETWEEATRVAAESASSSFSMPITETRLFLRVGVR